MRMPNIHTYGLRVNKLRPTLFSILLFQLELGLDTIEICLSTLYILITIQKTEVLRIYPL